MSTNRETEEKNRSAFEVSRDIGWRPEPHVAVVDVKGKDRARFLHGMLTQDVKGLQEWGVAWSNLVSVKGKLIAFFPIANRGDRLSFHCQEEAASVVVSTLSKYKVIDDVTLSLRPDVRVVSVAGAQADRWLSQLLSVDFSPAGANCGNFEALGGTISWMRVDLPVPNTVRLELSPSQFESFAEKARGTSARPIDDTAWETLRVEAGVPLIGRDMTDENLPLESHVLERGVSLTKGCYIGQETLVRVAHRGGHVSRRLKGVVGSTLTPAQMLGGELFSGEKAVGKITTAVHSQRLRASLGMGLIHRDALEVGTSLVLKNQEVNSDVQVVDLPLTAVTGC